MINFLDVKYFLDKESVRKSNRKVESIMNRFHGDQIADFILRSEHRDITDSSMKFSNQAVKRYNCNRGFETYEERMNIENAGISSYDFEENFGKLDKVHDMVVERCIINGGFIEFKGGIIYNLMMVNSNYLPYTFSFFLDDIYSLSKRRFEEVERNYYNAFKYLEPLYMYNLRLSVSDVLRNKENKKRIYKKNKRGELVVAPNEEDINSMRFELMNIIDKKINRIDKERVLEIFVKRLKHNQKTGKIYEPIKRYRDLGLTEKEEKYLRKEVDKRVKEYEEDIKEQRVLLKDDEMLLPMFFALNGDVERVKEYMKSNDGMLRKMSDKAFEDGCKILDYEINLLKINFYEVLLKKRWR